MHPNLKLPKPPRPAHPLCPERVTLDVHLAQMMGMFNGLYDSAAGGTTNGDLELAAEGVDGVGDGPLLSSARATPIAQQRNRPAPRIQECFLCR